MKRKLVLLLAVVFLTAFAATSESYSVYTYCEGYCEPGGESVFYKCGYGVSSVTCCQRAQEACPGGYFTGTCQDDLGLFYCY